MKNVNTEIEYLQQQILDRLNPVIMTNSEIMKLGNWFSSHPTVYKYEQNGNMFFSNDTDKANYISLLEQNTFFNSFPKNSLGVLPNEKIGLNFNIEVLGKASVHVAIIEYSYNEKKNSTLYPISSIIEHQLAEQTNQIRIALKISGKGVVILKNGEIKRSYEPLEAINTVNVIEKKTRKKSVKTSEELNMAVIFDEFTMTCYQKESNVITFTPDNFEEVLEANIPDLLFVESAWKGNGGSWEFKIAKYANQDKTPLIKLIEWCQRNEVPTIFWNKEDPIHYEKFIETAVLFDYIYTTDINMIEQYKKAANHQNVYALPFSAQPKMHNPICLPTERKNSVSFAGSYYGNRHIERRNDMDEVLDTALFLGLDIFDRNFEKNKHSITDFSFPKRFQKNIKSSLPYSKIPLAYKGYKYMANVNSIKYSPTMFSRRVFEGLASGTPIISSYSEGIQQFFGDIVMVSDEESYLTEKFKKVLSDERLYKKKKLAGIREVFQYHTYRNRLTFILENIGIKLEIKEDVTLLLKVRDEADVKEAIRVFKKQTYQNKKLVLISDLNPSNSFILNKYQTTEISIYLSSYLKHVQSFSEICSTKYMIYMNQEHFYGNHFITDLVMGALYSNADIITKSNYFEFKNNEIIENSKGLEYQFSNSGSFGNSLIKVSSRNNENAAELIEKMKKNKSLNNEFKSGVTIFSNDNCNFIKFGKNSSKQQKNKVEF